MQAGYLIIRFLTRAGQPHGDGGGSEASFEASPSRHPYHFSISVEHSRHMRICGTHPVDRSFAIPGARGREASTARISAVLARVAFVDASTEELRAAHDVLSEFYAEHLAGAP
jgi:hypothetical protein